MTLIFIGVFGFIMIVGALLSVFSKNLITAIIGSGVISLFASIIYLILAAPDVAMTEAAIGSGLTTIVFLYAFNKIRKIREDDNG